MLINKHILCSLCLEYAPDSNLDNKQDILNVVSAVTAIRFQWDCTFHACAKCLITLKSAYRLKQKFVRAIQLFKSLPEDVKVQYVPIASNINELIDLYPGKECLICQQVVSAENMGEHLKQHFETELTCDICNITVANIRDYKMHYKLAQHEEIIYDCPECDVTFLYKSLFNIHIKEHEKTKKIVKPDQKLIKEVNIKVEKEIICFEEEPMVNSEEMDNELLGVKIKPKKVKNCLKVVNEKFVRKARVKKSSKKTMNMKKRKSYELRKYKTHKKNKKQDTKLDELEGEEIKYMCLECSATFKIKSLYMIHLKRHFNDGDIDIYLLELMRNEMYGPVYKYDRIIKRTPNRKLIGSRRKKSKYGPQNIRIPRNPVKGRKTIYDEIEQVPRADIKEEKVKVEDEVIQAKERPNEEQRIKKPVPLTCFVKCEMCSILVNMKMHECPKRKLICEYCGDEFQASYKCHHTCYRLAKHAKKEPVQCTIDFTPESKRSFWDVMNEELPKERMVSTERVKCQDCPVVMDMNLHSCPNRMVLCEYCGVALTGKNCRHHFLSRHSKGKIFKCAVCGQLCSNKMQLYRHKKKHRPKQEYVCSYCGKNFPRSTTMRVHERQHTNEAPYKCDICGEAFKQNVLLRRHRSSVHKLFETLVCACDKCDKEFSSHVALDSHIHRVHSGTENNRQSLFS